MQITISRPLVNDRPWLESTWHHVSEEEGVRLQLQEVTDPAVETFDREYGHNLVLRFVEQRRVVKGTFHPGRKVLPASAITYELVYDCGIPADTDVEDEELLKRIRRVFRLYDIVGKIESGNVTAAEKEE